MEERKIYEKPKITFREYLSHVRSATIKIGIAFLIIMLISTLVLYFDVGGVKTELENLFEGFIEELSGLIDEEGNIDTVRLILNNIRVTFVALALGLIPFIFLPVFVLIVNAIIVGVLLGMVSVESLMAAFNTFALGIMPHGILELPAIFISIATGLILCSTINKTIRKKYKNMTITEALINGLKTVVFICIPLMIVAGIIETQITPKLLMMTM